MKNASLKRGLVSLSVFLFVVFPALWGCENCSRKKVNEEESETSDAERSGWAAERERRSTGLVFEIVTGTGGRVGAHAPVTRAQTQPLSGGEKKNLLARLSPLETVTDEKKEFAFRTRSLPPPRAVTTRKEVFPPPEKKKPAPDISAEKTLEILRYAPEGRVDMAPRISVTFSQPMTALSSHEASGAKGVPVRIEPEIKGKWRWVGTDTLFFEAEKRLPMATSFTVTVEAGARAMSGAELKETVKWTFETPAPTVIGGHPIGGPHPVNPVFALLFDQEIDAQKALSTVRLRGGAQVGLRVARKDEIQKDEAISRFVKSAPENRILVFKADSALDSDTSYQVVVGPGTPSREGPLRTREEQLLSFRTYAPLSIVSTSCERQTKCRPMSSMFFVFNNPIDEGSIETKDVNVSPPVPGMDVTIRGSVVYVRGKTRANTDYQISLPAKLKDSFGQELGRTVGRTFYIGRAEPDLSSGYGSFAVLDPDGDKKFRVRSINFDRLSLKVYRVNPGDWDTYMEYSSKFRWSNVPVKPPGKLVDEKILKVEGRDEMVETGISLQPYLNEKGYGQLVVKLSQWPLPDKKRDRKYVLSWVQVTDLALDAFVDHGRVLAWVSRLKDGKPVEGAEVFLAPTSFRSKSKADGLASLDLPVDAAAHRVLVARKGSDTAVLPESIHRWHRGGWRKTGGPGEVVRWYVFDDRNLYRPNEEVRVKGWVRAVDMGQGAGIRLLTQKTRNVRFIVYDPLGNKVGEGGAPVDAAGGFDFKFGLPDNVNLGHARVAIELEGVSIPGREHSHRFRIQEFKRPDFEVATEASEGPHIVGASVHYTARATYFAGGGLPNTPVRWRFFSSRAQYRPPNRDEYTFVGWTPSWLDSEDSIPQTSEVHESRTDSRGEDSLEVRLKELNPSRPVNLRASVTVTDVDRRTWTSEKNVLVHPSDIYVGLKTDRYFVDRGVPLNVDAVVTDLDGTGVENVEIFMRAVRNHWRYEKGEWKTVEQDPQECRVRSSREPVRCSFETKEGGRYTIEAVIRDEKGRTNTTFLTRWVSGGSRPPSRRVEREEVHLIPDRETYEPGQTAEVLVQSPFPGAEGLMTIRRSGIVKKERFSIQGNTKVLKIPITEKALPGLRVHVDLIGATYRFDDQGKPLKKLHKRPAFGSGSVVLRVPTVQKRLSVKVTPAEPRLSPGGETTIDVEVSDANGKPVEHGRVAVIAVDEAVLALTGYSIANPIGVFYPMRSEGVTDHHFRSSVHLMDPLKLDESLSKSLLPEESEESADIADAPRALPRPAGEPAPARQRGLLGLQEKGVSPHEKQPMIAVRTDFSPLALFVADAKTNRDGRVTVSLKLPDNLTRYRITAVAVSSTEFYGKGEGNVTAAMPLMIRPSPPRFLNFGDRFHLPVVVHNRTDREMLVDVAARAANLKLENGSGVRIKVPADDRREVLFEAKTVMAGQARVQIAGSAGTHSDAAEISIPVWTPATAEAFASYGTIDNEGDVQPVAAPPDAIPVFGGLEINTSSTALSSLTDAFLYLYEYPFACAEQLASRILAVAALRDVLEAFKAKGFPGNEAIERMMKRDSDQLRSMQNNDGGFGFWTAGTSSWPFVSIHVTHAMLRAKEKGYTVDENMLSRALGYVKTVESRIPAEYSERVRRVIESYGHYVRALADDIDQAGARRVFNNLMEMRPVPLEAIGWLYPVFVKSKDREVLQRIRTLLNNRVTETASSASFRTSYEDGAHLILHSDRRVDGLLLEGLILDNPRSDLAPKIVRSLLGHRKRGRWMNTQENAWVLLGLDLYFRTFEKETPNFTASLWLGDLSAAAQNFKGRSTQERAIEIPMSQLVEILDGGMKDLVLSKKGRGRLYYRVSMRYAPSDLILSPANHGFTVERRYEAVDDPEDVKRNPADGSWRIKAGSRVKVTLTMAAHDRRTHVALIDPLPAGLEAVNTALRGTERSPPPKAESSRRTGLGIGRRRGFAGGGGGRLGLRIPHPWWRRAWFEHQNIRDERVEAFTSLLPAGVHTFEYTAQALTPGRFVAPPPRAEEMYHPETFGRGATDVVVVY